MAVPLVAKTIIRGGAEVRRTEKVKTVKDLTQRTQRAEGTEGAEKIGRLECELRRTARNGCPTGCSRAQA